MIQRLRKLQRSKGIEVELTHNENTVYNLSLNDSLIVVVVFQ